VLDFRWRHLSYIEEYVIKPSGGMATARGTGGTPAFAYLNQHINDTEAALIDCISEHCRDVKDAQMRKRFSMFVRDRTDEEKEQAQTEWFETDMPAMLAKLEACVKTISTSKGCSVGSSISYADVSIYLLLKECFPASQEATLEAAKDCPLLLEICDSVSNHPSVKRWIETRPDTNF